jgi:hypothetical protein
MSPADGERAQQRQRLSRPLPSPTYGHGTQDCSCDARRCIDLLDPRARAAARRAHGARDPYDGPELAYAAEWRCFVISNSPEKSIMRWRDKLSRSD